MVMVRCLVSVAESTLMEAETTVPGINTTVTTVDKGRVRVDLSVDEKIKKGVFEGELKLKTTDTAKSDVKIPIRGVIL